jgi:hypothetical protein
METAMNARAIALAGLLVVLPGTLVSADVWIPASASVGPLPLSAGTGLAGCFYCLPADSDHWVRTNDYAKSVIASMPPSSIFQATWLSYDSDPNLGDATPIGTFLGADGNSLQGPNTALGNCVLTFTGYLAIRPEMNIDANSPGISVVFGLNSDEYLFSGLRAGW